MGGSGSVFGVEHLWRARVVWCICLCAMLLRRYGKAFELGTAFVVNTWLPRTFRCGNYLEQKDESNYIYRGAGGTGMREPGLFIAGRDSRSSGVGLGCWMGVLFF
jgi:hypothetical protein